MTMSMYKCISIKVRFLTMAERLQYKFSNALLRLIKVLTSSKMVSNNSVGMGKDKVIVSVTGYIERRDIRFRPVRRNVWVVRMSSETLAQVRDRSFL